MFYEFAERRLGLEPCSHVALKLLSNIVSQISKTMCRNHTKTWGEGWDPIKPV